MNDARNCRQASDEPNIAIVARRHAAKLNVVAIVATLLFALYCSVVEARGANVSRSRLITKRSSDSTNITFGEMLTVHANQTSVDRRTIEVWLTYRQCVEARIRVEGKRTR